MPPLLGVVLASCRGGGGEEGDEAAPDSAMVAVQTAAAEVRAFPVTVSALGSVAVAPGHFASVAAPAPVRVTAVYVSTGSRVSAGQPLVALDRTAWAADARRAAVAAGSAERDAQRQRSLASAGIVPRKDAEAAASAAAEAQATLVETRHLLAQGVLRSPISGVVSRVSAALNAVADPSQPLVDVVDPRGLELVFSVPPEDAGRLHSGSEVRVTAGRSNGGQLLGTGRVTGVSAVIDTVSGSVDVRVALANPLGGLFAGEDVSGLFTVGDPQTAVAVPADAVVPAGDGYQVFVIDAAGVAHARPVTVGARSETAVQIASGLQGGETVATRGAYGLQDGAHVRRAAR